MGDLLEYVAVQKPVGLVGRSCTVVVMDDVTFKPMPPVPEILKDYEFHDELVYKVSGPLELKAMADIKRTVLKELEDAVTWVRRDLNDLQAACPHTEELRLPLFGKGPDDENWLCSICGLDEEEPIF